MTDNQVLVSSPTSQSFPLDSSPLDFSTLNPQTDHVAICRHLVGEVFAWDMTRSLELALLRTFCVPRIAALLRQTGEFIHRPQKRYDDTGLILGNILKWGYDSPQGQQAIARMNRIHRHYPIENEDFLYVLAASAFEPIRWNQAYGWRPFTEVEKQALFYFWQAVGDRMGIQNIPPTAAAFAAFKADYEDRYFVYSPDNAALGAGVLHLMQQWMPPGVGRWVPGAVSALLDEPMRRALGWPDPNPVLVTTLGQYFRCRRWLVGRGLWRQPRGFFVDRPNHSYPQGYAIEELGPQGEVPSAPTPSRCPFMRMRALMNL